MEVKFYYNIGFSNASREEIFEYEGNPTDEELQQDFDIWASNFIDCGFYRIGEKE